MPHLNTASVDASLIPQSWHGFFEGEGSLPCQRGSSRLNGTSTAGNYMWRGEVSQPDTRPPLVVLLILLLFLFFPISSCFSFLLHRHGFTSSLTHNSQSFMAATHHQALIKQFWHSKYFVPLITASLFASYSVILSRPTSEGIRPSNVKPVKHRVLSFNFTV